MKIISGAIEHFVTFAVIGYFALGTIVLVS